MSADELIAISMTREVLQLFDKWVSTFGYVTNLLQLFLRG